MDERTYWFIGGLFVLAILSSSAPKLAGGFVILLVIVLALELSKSGKLSPEQI